MINQNLDREHTGAKYHPEVLKFVEEQLLWWGLH